MQHRSLPKSGTTAAATLAAPALRAQALTPIRFSLDFRVTGQTAPFFLAQARGHHRDEGLDVAIDVAAARWRPSPAWPAVPATCAWAPSAR